MPLLKGGAAELGEQVGITRDEVEALFQASLTQPTAEESMLMRIAHHRGGINPTDLNAVQEAVVGDVIHHQTDFVGVPTHRYRAGGIFIADRREAVPIRVVPTLVGPLTGVVGPQLLPLTFKSGGAGRVEEGSEERKRF